MRVFCLWLALVFAFPAADIAHGDDPPPVHWIWSRDRETSGVTVRFEKEFAIETLPDAATLLVAGDFCQIAVSINGHEKRIAPYSNTVTLDATTWLRAGPNKISLSCRSVAGPSAVMARLELQHAGGSTFLPTDSAWQSVQSKGNRAAKATSYGPVAGYRYGLDQSPITISPLDDYTQWKRAINSGEGTDPRTFDVAAGFEVDLIHSAREGEDSWVSLAVDPKGRWIIGQEQQGLLRLSIGEGDQVKVDRINDSLRECRGLQFKDGALFALANNDKALYRLRDTTGDDQFDSVEKRFEFGGDVGHGRNQLTLSPDGTLFGIFGDAVIEPDSLSSLVPPLANPSEVDKTRNGFVIRFEDDIDQSTVITRGLRNPYGIAFNRYGDMFTYDADAEYDMGSSWYRPTRVLHLIPGGDYRWRRVTKQWPPYFPDQADMPRPTLDIGKGSPTAVTFASGEQFPARYQDALFILDWAYGRIVAVHLTPRGSSYHATPETFLRGAPLNVTDVEFGPDGAMYFTTGGRKTQSALYRVRYVGEQATDESPTEQQIARQKHAEESRRIRNALHDWVETPNVTNLEAIWSHLASDDPWIRHAARTALERLPVNAWRERALRETSTRTRLAAHLALLRVDNDPPLSDIAAATFPTDASYSRDELLEVFAIAERLLDAHANLPTDQAKELWSWIRRVQVPTNDWALERRLLLLQSRRPAGDFARRTIHELAAAGGLSDDQRFHFLFVLRNVPNGWTPELRETYFKELQQLEEHVGGQGMPTFRRLIREEALASVPANERPRFATMLEKPAPAWVEEIPSEPREFVRKWKLADFDDGIDLSQADLAIGRQVYAAASCIRCHRFQGRGDVTGPDLTSVARRFAPRDLLLSVLHPSKVVSEKYASATIELADGRVVTGSIAPGDYRSPDLVLVPNLLEPAKTVKVAKIDIVQRGQSTVSPMPAGLLDTFSREEIIDLIGYLTSAER